MDDIKRSFQQADFSSSDKSLEERIWQRIVSTIEGSNAQEEELSDAELMHIAAAGLAHRRKPEDKA